MIMHFFWLKKQHGSANQSLNQSSAIEFFTQPIKKLDTEKLA